MPTIKLTVNLTSLQCLMVLAAAQKEKSHIEECRFAEAGDEDRSYEWEEAKNAWDEIHNQASWLRRAINDAVHPLSRVGIELDGIVPDEDDDDISAGIDAMRTAFENLISIAEKAKADAIQAKGVSA